ncbi:MAG: phosphotransferase family protein [Acidimicrobiales bacterium]
MSDGTLPDDLREWIESTTGATIVHATRHLVGASRMAWSVDAERNGTAIALFTLRDSLSSNGGSLRDGEVLAALMPTPIPVPFVYGVDERLGAVLLERVHGRSDFPSVDHEEEREPTARDLMHVTAKLHALEPSSLPIAHLGSPGPASCHADEQLGKVEGIATMLGDRIAPLFSFALAWMRRNVPTQVDRTSLVHSDMGPGNFLYRHGRVTAVLDWEVAHWGDAMEDLAAIAVRDMATPVGHLPTRYAEYAAASGAPVDLTRVSWYRILVLTRNSMLIGLGLAHDDAAVDRVQLTMFRTLLMRAVALALCDAIGVERPGEGPLVEGAMTDDLRLTAHVWRDQRDTVVPAVSDSFAAHRANEVAAALGYLDHRMRFGGDYLQRELDDLATLLGHRPPDEISGFMELRSYLGDASSEREIAAFFGRHLLRRAMLFAPLLGPLMERMPQPLEDE